MKAVQTLFRDLLLLLVMSLAVLVLLFLPHLNPPAQEASKDVTSPGSMIVEISWPDDSDHDVDLWVKGPDSIAVGYSSLSGPVFNLLRDDLGHVADLLKLNYETAYSRGLPPGEYIINLHLFRIGGGGVPVPVSMRVSTKHKPGDAPLQIFESVVSMLWLGQELTAVRFRLDETGAVIPSSKNASFQSIRGAKQ